MTTHYNLGHEGSFFRSTGHGGSQGRNKVLCKRNTDLELPWQLLQPSEIQQTRSCSSSCDLSLGEGKLFTGSRNPGVVLLSVLSFTPYIHLISAGHHLLPDSLSPSHFHVPLSVPTSAAMVQALLW